MAIWRKDYSWTKRRKTAFIGIALAILTFPVCTWGLFELWPVEYAGYTRLEIIIVALQSLSVVALFSVFMLSQTSRLVDVPAAEDVLAGEPGLESLKWRKNSRIYLNTVEQGLTFATALLALSTIIAPQQAHILPVLAIIWLGGRIAFFIGYHIDPAYRAVGFDYTLFPSLVALSWFFLALCFS